MKPEQIFSHRATQLRPSPIRELAPLMSQPNMISLGGGYPNPDTFAFASLDVRFRDGSTATLEGSSLTTACQYGPTDVDASLREHVLAWHEAKDGVRLPSAQLQMLNGAQEGLFIMAYLCLEPGDAVVISEPAYPGAVSSFGAFSNEFIPVPVDANGTVVSVLEERLVERRNMARVMPKFIYEVPNGHNPAGVALSLERRHELLRLASAFDLLVLEDDPYQLVQLEPRDPLPTLQSLDREGRVLRLDSFSKIFAPGLRLGYASGPEWLIRQFGLCKQALNLHTSSMAQSLLAQYLQHAGAVGLRTQIRRNCELYRRNRDAMLDAAREFLPRDISYNVPGEGMFLWFEFAPHVDTRAMVQQHAVSQGVLLVPGAAFSTTGKLRNCMRASFSMVSPEQVREGIRRLSLMLATQL